MSRVHHHYVVIVLILFGILANACGRMPVPTIAPTKPPPTATATPTPLPTATPTPITPTRTPTIALPTGTPAPFILKSSAFGEGNTIPGKYTCNAENISPPLTWTGTPHGTKSFVLMMDDPDAVVTTFTHWIAFDIPGTQTEIAENVKSLGKGGLNSAKRNVYLGPCPPSGSHRYIFILTALDLEQLGLNEGANRPDIERAMLGHILAKTQLMGLYPK